MAVTGPAAGMVVANGAAIVFAIGKLSLDFLHFRVLVLCLTGVIDSQKLLANRGYGAMLSLRSKLLLLGAVLAATLIVGAASADAQCYWYRPVAWTCYTPCYTACYTPCYYGTYSTWYLGWRPGPIRRLILGPYRWYWAGYGGVWYGDCCWTTTAWYDCCVSRPAAGSPAHTSREAIAATDARAGGKAGQTVAAHAHPNTGKARNKPSAASGRSYATGGRSYATRGHHATVARD